ncbi:ATP-binding cassette domain-containing protein [Desulfobacterales bacterium HSG16]|nr:ATP-binding cassette domain-containing protein [Desulfobacterales bacterium HSG16]
MDKYIYKIRGLKHYYNSFPALEIDELSLHQGSIVGLIGPNGSGKSTLLNLLGFIDNPTFGKILFKNKPAAPFSESVRFQVTILPQTPYLMKRSVYKNIEYGLKLRGDKNDRRKMIYDALSMVGMSGDEFVSRRWFELSGGEAQRVALAARLVLKPEVLLLDEPIASVDAASAQLIKDASIRACREWGTTLIITSHDWQWMYEVCDRMLQLFRGRFFGSGSETILFGPWHENADGLWKKVTGNGEDIIVSKPPKKDSVAVISTKDISVQLPDDQVISENLCLKGMISRLVLEKNTGCVISTIIAGSQPFNVKFTQKQVRKLNLYPGSDVNIGYNPDSIKWL